MEKTGVLYGVSVGPGDPGLMTLAAAEVIRRCPVIAAPRTAGGRTLALDIAAGAVDLTGKTVLTPDFAMAPEPSDRRQAHRLAARALAAELAAGRDTAFLTLGDVSLYASFDYVEALVRELGFETRRVAGVPSFCAAAARLGISLAAGEEPVHILPAGPAGAAEAMGLSGTKVILKAGRGLAGTAAALRAAKPGFAALVENCGLPGERIRLGAEAIPEESGYFAALIVKE